MGKFTAIAEGFELVAFGHKIERISSFPFDTVFDVDSEYTKIYDPGFVIGNDVYIGDHVTLHHGCEIGDGSVIGARSVVAPHTLVEPYSVYLGNPAVKVRDRFQLWLVYFLKELKWWDLPIDEIREIRPLLESNDFRPLMSKYPGVFERSNSNYREDHFENG